MHNKEALEERWAALVESPEESNYNTNVTKYPAYNTPNSTETSLKPSDTNSFGVTRPKLSFLATTINATFNKAYDERYPIPTVKHGGGSLMFGAVRATKAQELWSELMAG